MEWTVAIGVDTHKELHVAVALDVLGARLDSREIATTPAGYRSLLSWAQELGVPAFAVEGTGSYGAGLVRFLERAGVSVYECERPRRQERRHGKSDLIDAGLAARRLVGGERLSVARGGGGREDLRLLLLERRSAMQARNAALNQLHALAVTAPDHVRERLGALSGQRLAYAAARLRPRPDVTNGVLRRLGRRVERLAREVADAEDALAALLAEVASDLLEECGVGPVCGAQLLVSSGDPSRIRERGILRRARRHESGRRLERQAATPPAQPWRRPPTQLGAARRRPRTNPPPRRDHRLLPAATRIGQDDQGSTPLRQTRPRPLLLPTAARDADARLDNIEASVGPFFLPEVLPPKRGNRKDPQGCGPFSDLVRAEDARLDRMRDRHRLSNFCLRQGRRLPWASWGVARRKWLSEQRFDFPAQQHSFDMY